MAHAAHTAFDTTSFRADRSELSYWLVDGVEVAGPFSNDALKSDGLGNDILGADETPTFVAAEVAARALLELQLRIADLERENRTLRRMPTNPSALRRFAAA